MYNKKGVSFSTRYKRKTDDFRGGVCHEKNKKIQTWQEEHPDPAGDGIYRDLCDSDPVDQYYFLLYQIAGAMARVGTYFLKISSFSFYLSKKVAVFVVMLYC